MDLFSVLSAVSPITGAAIRIQFKYVERLLRGYTLGDRIEFPVGTDFEATRVTLVGGLTEAPMSAEESGSYEIRFEYGFPIFNRPIGEDQYDRLENNWQGGRAPIPKSR